MEKTHEKRLSSRERTEPEAIARLRSERILLGLLSGTNITPRLLDHGEDERGPWHRMEVITLPTLAERLSSSSSEKLDPAWVDRAVHSSFAALAILHEATDEHSRPLDVVHADLSPSNMAISDDAKTVRILDLDLAWWRDGPLRTDGAFRGTIGYVAPEVARGERPTQQSDLFALAATLLHALRRSPPRPGSSFAALLALAAEHPILNAVERAELERQSPARAALALCLAHDPNDRPASARAVVDRLA